MWTKNKPLLVLIVLMLIFEAAVTGLLPMSKGYMIDALTAKNALIITAIGLYFVNYMSYDFVNCFKDYCITKYSLVQRETDTRSIDIRYVQTVSVDNPAQRVQEDIKLKHLYRNRVLAEFFVSGIIVVQLVFINYKYPLLVALSLGYAGLSVLIAMRFNPRLVQSEKEIQAEEATYRADVQDKIKRPSLPYASANILVSLDFANKATMFAQRVRLNYLLFTKLQLGLLMVLPFLILLPDYLGGLITLGDVMMHQTTFSLLVVNAAIIIQYYPMWITSRASAERVAEISNQK